MHPLSIKIFSRSTPLILFFLIQTTQIWGRNFKSTLLKKEQKCAQSCHENYKDYQCVNTR
jgi:hypothetical protein